MSRRDVPSFRPGDTVFLLVKLPAATRIAVVTDWFAEVKKAFGMEE